MENAGVDSHAVIFASQLISFVGPEANVRPTFPCFWAVCSASSRRIGAQTKPALTGKCVTRPCFEDLHFDEIDEIDG